ncbi:MAG TPA: DUF3307 domain-containing protein [Bacteroidales bacterium]|nr:DUF3307 domain-containing protein [Bacteroidales bacterium]
MYRILILVIMHIAGDFLLQGKTLSRLKASKVTALLAHVGIYTLFFIAISPLLLGLTFIQGLIFSSINAATHLVIDFFTAKFKKIYWQQSEGKYLAVISIDHILHILILITTYIYMYPEALKF